MTRGGGHDRHAADGSAPRRPAAVDPQAWSLAAAHRRDMQISLAAAVAGSLCQVVVPLIERQIVDGVIVRHTSALWPWLVALVALATATFGFSYVRRYRGGRLALAVQYDLRNAMHDHLQTMDFGNLDRMPTGQLVARANSDSTLIQGLLSFYPIISGNVLMVLLSLGVMFYLSPLLALVSLVVVPALFVVSYRMRWRVFPATWDGQQREGDIAQIVDEDVGGVRVVKAFGQERRELDRVVEGAQKLYGSRMRAVRLQSRYQPLLASIPTFGQVAILALGGWLALRHQISLGTFLAFSTYVTQFAAPARQVAGLLTIGQQARAGVERIFQLLDLAPAIADAPGAVELPALRGEIEIRDVHLRYGDGAPVLRGLDLHIAAGERVALVGRSGSGKSTVALLASRFQTLTRAPSSSTDTTCVTSRCIRCAARSASSSRRASCSPTPSARTSPTAAPTPASGRSKPPHARRRRTNSSPSYRSDTKRWSASAA